MALPAGAYIRNGLAFAADGSLLVTANGSASITGGTVGLDDGAAGTPSLYRASTTNTGIYFGSSNMFVTRSGVTVAAFTSTAVQLIAADIGQAADAIISRTTTNSLQFGASATVASATARTEINKAITAFTNAVAKATVTITIPNAAHSASVLFRVTGSIGAGGAIGANEASATNCYVITLTRTAGVNATAAISSAFGAAATAVAGATTVTATAAMSAVSGAVGATNTFTVDVTITRGGGTSDNHTAVVTASLLNANATGITIS